MTSREDPEHDQEEYNPSGMRPIATLKEERTAETAQLAYEKSQDAQRRYAYLMDQTDIFQHFIGVSQRRSNGNSSNFVNDLKELKNNEKTDKKSGKGSKRKSEKEEDEEMLKKANVMDEEDESYTFSESPSYISGGVMRDYQVQGLNWLVSLNHNGINGILADEMGLGKTLQTISFLGYLKFVEKSSARHLVIVPKSTLHNWISEFKKWCPRLKAFLFHGSKEERQVIIKEEMFGQEWDICVTSYEMCLIEKAVMKKVSWGYMVIDEAHRIKNENSLLSQIVRLIPCRSRLLITGTPLQNDLHELWALLNFLLPDIFTSSADFDSWFTIEQGGDQDAVIQQLHKILRPFLLRRIKADVEKSLLPKKRIDLYVGMSSMQREWYKKLLEKDISAVNGVQLQGASKRLQNIVMQLRKCCNHPYLFDGAEVGPPYTTDQHIVDNAGKLVILDKLLDKVKSQGSRVLLFSQMSRMVDILEDYCVWKGYDYCRLDGQTSHQDRIDGIDEFNREGSSKFIYLLTTRAGGLGINLATADTVIMYDNDWNPQVDLQAEDRAHRIGQKKQVVVFRFITENAIEEKVIDRASQKLRLDQLVIQQGRHVSSSGELVSLIQYGAESIFQSTSSTISSDGLDSIFEKSERKSLELMQKYKDMGLDDLQQFSTDFNAYRWEGKDFQNKKNDVDWIGPGKRDRKSLVLVKKAARPKTVNYNDFHFYPREILSLLEMEKYHYWNINNIQLSAIDAPMANCDEWLQQESLKIRNAAVFQDEEKLLSLAKQGFESWSKRDFLLFIKASEKHSKPSYDLISAEIPGKSRDEVKAYSDVFWSRYKEIGEGERLVANILKSLQRLDKVDLTNQQIALKVNAVQHPLQALKLPLSNSKQRVYTDLEDRFLIHQLSLHRYGSEDLYLKIKKEIRNSVLFRFDWYFKSRSVVELQRRCTALVTLMEKELGEGKKRSANDLEGRAKKIKVAML